MGNSYAHAWLTTFFRRVHVMVLKIFFRSDGCVFYTCFLLTIAQPIQYDISDSIYTDGVMLANTSVRSENNILAAL